MAVTILLAGCTHRYRPAEYVLATDRIPGFTVSAPVQITSDASSGTEYVVLRNMGHRFVTSNRQLTDVLVAQLAKEIVKRGGIVSGNAARTIRATVENMQGRTGFATIQATVLVRLQLGDGPARTLSVMNRSPANVYRAMNGAIARAVIQILTDHEVLAYLGDPAPVPESGRHDEDSEVK